MEKSTNTNCYEKQKIRGLQRKWDAIFQKGGKCEKCGYDKNIAALEFHHLDPNNKEFQLDVRSFSNTNLNSLQQEIDKCILLCSNCHREIHNEELSFENIPILLEGSTKISFGHEYGDICPVCGNRFPKSKGKIYCSKECREKDKKYPDIEEVLEQYELLHSWDKVATHFGLTRKIIQGIRNRALTT